MAMTQTISYDADDRISPDREDARLPLFVAVPIWISLALVAWSPFILLFRAITS